MKTALSILAASVAGLCIAPAAQADANIGVYLSTPGPVYAAPPPVVYVPQPVYGEYDRPDRERERRWREHDWHRRDDRGRGDWHHDREHD